jgi:hypothetical protein
MQMVEMSKRVPMKKPEARPEISSKPGTAPKSRAEKGPTEAAHKAAKTEQQYDRDNSIFSK